MTIVFTLAGIFGETLENKNPMKRKLTQGFLSAMFAFFVSSASVSGALLLDEFLAGDGTGGTYVIDRVDNQSGGFGWAPGSSWLMNGSGILMDVTEGNYVSVTRNMGNTTGSSRGMRREFADPGIANFEIRTRIEFADLAGFDLLNPEGAPSTGGGGNITDDDYFAISPRDTAGGLASTIHWYVEAVGGFWYAMPGSGSSYGTPMPVAPLIEGETYDLSIRFSGEDTWALSVYLHGEDETYETGWLSYINPNNNTDDNMSHWLHYRFYNQPPESNYDIRIHEISIIPEPSAYALGFGGIALLVAAVWRCRRKAA